VWVINDNGGGNGDGGDVVGGDGVMVVDYGYGNCGGLWQWWWIMVVAMVVDCGWWIMVVVMVVDHGGDHR
jgi:hypothetical protein